MRLDQYAVRSVTLALGEVWKGPSLFVRHRKTGKHVWIPCHEDLVPLLDELKLEGKSLYFIHDTRGRPLKERYHADLWDSVSAIAGVKGRLQRRDLRRTAAIIQLQAHTRERRSRKGPTD